MDLLIKNVQIPKDDIRIALFVHKDGSVNIFENGKLVRSTDAIEVPTHGRLGDLDALKTYLDNTIKEATEIGLPVTSEYLMGLIDDAVKNAPTIIEASKERE